MMQHASRAALLMLVLAAVSRAQQAGAGPIVARQATLSHTIGDDASAGVTIGRVAGLGVSDAGEVFVLDGADVDVKAFDLRGKFLRRFGRRGGGPGEFQRPVSLDVIDSTVSVRTRGNGTVVFTQRGRYVATHLPGVLSAEGAALRHGFRLVAESPTVLPSPTQQAKPDDVSYAQFLVLYGPNGSSDSIVEIRLDRVMVELAGGTRVVRPSGFGDSGTWAILGDSIVAVVDGYTGDVEWLRAGNNGLTAFRRATLGTPGALVTPADVRKQEARLGASTGVASTGGSTVAGAPRGRATILSPPERWSAATRALFSADGSLWVGAPLDVIAFTARGWTRTIENNTWTVFPLSQPPFRVTLPSSAVLRAVSGAYALCVPAEQGAPIVEVYRVQLEDKRERDL